MRAGSSSSLPHSLQHTNDTAPHGAVLPSGFHAGVKEEWGKT